MSVHKNMEICFKGSCRIYERFQQRSIRVNSSSIFSKFSLFFSTTKVNTRAIVQNYKIIIHTNSLLQSFFVSLHPRLLDMTGTFPLKQIQKLLNRKQINLFIFYPPPSRLDEYHYIHLVYELKAQTLSQTHQ